VWLWLSAVCTTGKSTGSWTSGGRDIAEYVLACVKVVEHCDQWVWVWLSTVFGSCVNVLFHCVGMFYHVSKMWSTVLNRGCAEQAGSVVLLCIKVV
jgi:hypothetical protein